MYISYNQDNWDTLLTPAEFAYNNAKQVSTGFSPFFLNNGRHPYNPANLLDLGTPVQAVETWIKDIANLEKIARDNIQLAQNRQTQNANLHRREDTFEEGDQVLLSTAYINPQKERPTKKLQQRFIGPYTIAEVISNTAYKLVLPHTLKIHSVFHISLLRRYTPNDEEL